MNHVQISMLIIAFMLVLFLYASLKIKSKKQSEKSVATHSRQEPKIPEEHRNNPKEISGKHKKYRDRPYRLICSDEVFSDDEMDILTEYGSWLDALTSGTIEPETDSQRKFIQLCKNNKNLQLREMLKNLDSCKSKIDNIQFTWLKYLCRIQLERENPEFIKKSKQETPITNNSLKIKQIYHIKRQIEFQTSLPDTVQRKAVIKILQRELTRLKT